MKKCMVCGLFAAALTFQAAASWSPLGVSFFSPAELPFQSWEIRGIRANVVYGSHNGIMGIDTGLFNDVKRDAWGLQSGLVNHVGEDFYGIQDGLVGIVAGNFTGLQVAWFGACRGACRGLQVGAVNWTRDLAGCQIGVMNNADVMDGLQIGIINWAENVRGIQIGLFNSITESTVCFAPVLNVHW